MPNAIKYNTNAETLALKKGNFWIGTGDVGKGPSSSTGFYNGLTPTSGGYVIYSYNPSLPGNTAYFTVANDSELITYTNRIAGTSYTTANECLVYYAGQTDKVCVNIDYPAIVTSGLTLNLDAGFTPSYPRTNTTWYNVSLGGNNGTLTNGPTYSSTNGGSIVFDGVDDYCDVPIGLLTTSNSFTVEFIAKFTDNVYSMTGGMSTYGACYPYFYGGIAGFEGYAGVYTRASNISPYTGFGSFGIIFQSGPQYSVGVNNISINVPYIITSTYSPTTIALYINGSLSISASTGNSPAFDTNGLRLGSGNRSFNGFFNGTIYSYKQYNRVLSSVEILQNYNAQKSRYGL
jgi:hypothetical protein